MLNYFGYISHVANDVRVEMFFLYGAVCWMLLWMSLAGFLFRMTTNYAITHSSNGSSISNSRSRSNGYNNNHHKKTCMRESNYFAPFHIVHLSASLTLLIIRLFGLCIVYILCVTQDLDAEEENLCVCALFWQRMLKARTIRNT